jgi:uncharacterized membrane protein
VKKVDVVMSGEEETVEESVNANSRFFWLLIAGFVLVFVGITVIFVAAVLYSGGSASAGAVIFIGPFPIVIGAGPDVTWIVLLSIIIAVLSVVVFLVMNRRMRRFGV